MIRYLGIQRLAVIDAVEIEFQPGFNVLTGETGAGKSILVEALGLLAGGRASADLVRTGEESATIQAVFETASGEERIVRRELTAQGRSRAFIDGSLATTAALRELGTGLVDLYGQHEHQRLLDARAHLDLLDAYAGLDGLREQVAEAYAGLHDLRAVLARLQTLERDRAERLERLQIEAAEIDGVAPAPGEDEELGRRRQVLANAGRFQHLCHESYAALYESERSVLAALAAIWRQVEELARLDPAFLPHVEARDAIKSQLEELAYLLRSCAAGIDASPERLEEVEARLARLERIKKKFGPALADVAARREAIARDLAELGEASHRADELSGHLAAARERYLAAARRLSAERRSAGRRFSRALERDLAELAMEHTRFEVRFGSEPPAEPDWTERGIDAVEFDLSPNPGEDLRPLARIASGGELSRIMRAIRTLASAGAPGRTLVFDEVDAGISGRVADAVGTRLRKLGSRFQVLCVTHLPQIAAYGRTHFCIEKHIEGDRTTTRVVRLDEEARIDELARIVGGREVTPRVRASARELLGVRHGEHTTKGESERAKAKGKRLG